MIRKIKVFLEMIKFEHSIFALPFAYLGFFLALAQTQVPGTSTSTGARHLFDLFEDNPQVWHQFIWVTIAMVAMRTAAMCFNRLLDHQIDAENPRTQNRALPKGLLTRRFTWIAAFLGVYVFMAAAGQLNDLCFTLAPIPIALALVYPLTKRWTWFAHWVLGLTLGIAPYGAWLAVKTEWNWIPGLLTIAVTSWVGGFDIFYALQDEAFDRKAGLHSLPARWGAASAIVVAKLSQGVTVAALIGAGILAGLGVFYWIGVALVSALIYHEHRLVDRFGLQKINEAFFNANAWVSVIIFAAVFLDLTLKIRS